MNNSKRPLLFGWLLASLFVFACLFVGPTTYGQETAPATNVPAVAAPISVSSPTTFSADSIITWLTPLLVPLIIAVKKKFAPLIPSWALPILAPVLGMILDYVNTLATSHQSNLLLAALLGLAGVGVREVKDQLVPAKPAL
jgi:hypothetical protein